MNNIFNVTKKVTSINEIHLKAELNEYFNIASSVYSEIPAGCCSHISVKNTSTQTIDVQNANLIVERVA